VVAAFLYGSSKQGVKAAATSALGGTKIAEIAAQQGLTKTAAQASGFAFVVTVVIATIMADLAKHDEKRATSERELRRDEPPSYNPPSN